MNIRILGGPDEVEEIPLERCPSQGQEFGSGILVKLRRLAITQTLANGDRMVRVGGSHGLPPLYVSGQNRYEALLSTAVIKRRALKYSRPRTPHGAK